MTEREGVHDDQPGELNARGVTVLERRKYTGRPGLQAMREVTSETLYDFTPAKPGEFETTRSVAHLGSAILFDLHMTSVHLDRMPLHIARGWLDHYQVGMFLEGGLPIRLPRPRG